MPKLTPVQWLIIVAVQIFVAFAVFAVTRDYYRRHPATASAAAPAPASAAAPTVGSQAVATPEPAPTEDGFGGDSVIPKSVVQKDPALLAQLGDKRLSQHRYQDAVAIYKRLLKLKPGDPEAYNDLGLALHYAGDSDQAVKVLTEGTRKNPDFQRMWLTLGFVQTKVGNAAAARPALKNAVDLGPNNAVGKEAKRMLGTL
jgi:tetratricopeptide (TPR) repeat protein